MTISVHRNHDYVSAKLLCTEIVILCQFLYTETDIKLQFLCTEIVILCKQNLCNSNSNYVSVSMHRNRDVVREKLYAGWAILRFPVYVAMWHVLQLW